MMAWCILFGRGAAISGSGHTIPGLADEQASLRISGNVSHSGN